jgi:hypothetical protein
MITIPDGALLFHENSVEVATLGRDNRVTLKKVRIARDLGTEVEITGLGQDERIVTNPPDSIGDGEEVRVMEAADDKKQVLSEQQGAQDPGDHPKSAGEMAQTGRDHQE